MEIIQNGGEVHIVGDASELDALGAALQLKSKMGDNYSCKLTSGEIPIVPVLIEDDAIVVVKGSSVPPTLSNRDIIEGRIKKINTKFIDAKDLNFVLEELGLEGDSVNGLPGRPGTLAVPVLLKMVLALKLEIDEIKIESGKNV